MFRHSGLYWSADTGAATGPTGDVTGNAETGNATGAETPNSGDKPGISFESQEAFQTAVEDILRERLERVKRKHEKESEDTRKAAEEKSLADRQEWQKLAESRAAELEKLAPLAAEAEQLAALIAQQLEARMKEWPPEVKALVPEEGTIATRLAMAEKAEAIMSKLAGQAVKPGNGPDPKQTARAGSSADADAWRKDINRTIRSAW